MVRMWGAVLVAAVLAVGCTAGDEDESPATAATISASDPVPGEVARLQPGASTDEIFVAVVHDGGVPLAARDLIVLGHIVCDYLEGGGTFAGYLAGTGESSLTPNQRSVLAGAAIGAYCPGQEHKVPGRGMMHRMRDAAGR